ncbi:TIGR03862 family flavoprotein [Roseibium sediminis]|uniref:TIGR03862 family flavoprotein n=1 Tax=Roseibium sediminis TaxID=1775174 RepID=UPI00123CE830|nr:TIGR03862 family flavoprotein [Roseibium sediminis]
MDGKTTDVLVIGAGAAGLYAADLLSRHGLTVEIAEQMRAPARKFLLAGRGGLNITHSEALPEFVDRYREAKTFLEPLVQSFSPQTLRQWCQELGSETFVGSSGRVFPTAMKASPLLRALMQRLDKHGVRLHSLHRWSGIDANGGFQFTRPDGTNVTLKARAVVLALGGASWPRLGSDGSWQDILKARSIGMAPFRPANCGFHACWSDILKESVAGVPLKRIALRLDDKTVQGEALISKSGLEGGAIYALSAEIRDRIELDGSATISLDLKPDLTVDAVEKRLLKPRGKQSASSWLRKTVGLDKAAQSLLRESGPLPQQPSHLAKLIKGCPVKLTAPYSIDRAISSAGGIHLDEVNEDLMLKKLPNVYAVGEMLDWEAPTGGYLLQACFSMAHHAASNIIRTLQDGHETGVRT